MAQELDSGITQLHSSQYRGPSGIPEGGVVVAGAGTSGAEIALELAQNRPAGTVYLAGRPTKHIPDAVFRFAGPLYWRLVNSLLTLDTKPGRKVAAGVPQARGAAHPGINRGRRAGRCRPAPPHQQRRRRPT